MTATSYAIPYVVYISLKRSMEVISNYILSQTDYLNKHR